LTGVSTPRGRILGPRGTAQGRNGIRLLSRTRQVEKWGWGPATDCALLRWVSKDARARVLFVEAGVEGQESGKKEAGSLAEGFANLRSGNRVVFGLMGAVCLLRRGSILAHTGRRFRFCVWGNLAFREIGIGSGGLAIGPEKPGRLSGPGE